MVNYYEVSVIFQDTGHQLQENTQPARNIPGIFAECFLSVEMFKISGEHLGNILKENIL